MSAYSHDVQWGAWAFRFQIIEMRSCIANRKISLWLYGIEQSDNSTFE